jgi:hypothetical protein
MHICTLFQASIYGGGYEGGEDSVLGESMYYDSIVHIHLMEKEEEEEEEPYLIKELEKHERRYVKTDEQRTVCLCLCLWLCVCVCV